MSQVGPQRYQLKEGTFNRAAEIDVLLGVGGVVRQMDFTYAPGTDYQELLSDFQAEIGPPTSHSGSGADQVNVWQDPNTEFRLVGASSGIHSKLCDRALTA